MSLFIKVDLHDGPFKNSPIITVPASCNPLADDGKKTGYAIYIPCQPCSGSRKMAEEPFAVVSSPEAGSDNNGLTVPADNTKAILPNIWHCRCFTAGVETSSSSVLQV
jgi:hypothetical protein